LGVFVLIVAWTMAYYWFSAPILAIETKTKPINTSTPASPSLPSPKVTTPVPSNANWGSTTPLLDIPDSFKSEIRSLKDKVTRIALEEGVPPEVPFVLWLKEAGGRRVNPSNKEGLCGFYSLVKSGKASFTPGPITSESELLAQLRLCAQEFKKRSSGISYETTSLAALGPVYMRYNGNLDCYGEPYPSWDLHPYVMNGMDKDHSNMIARDGKGGCIALKIIGAIPAHIRVGMVLREK